MSTTRLELPLGKCSCDVCYQPTDEAESFSVTLKGPTRTFTPYTCCESCVVAQRQDFIGTTMELKAERRFPAVPTYPKKG